MHFKPGSFWERNIDDIMEFVPGRPHLRKLWDFNSIKYRQFDANICLEPTHSWNMWESPILIPESIWKPRYCDEPLLRRNELLLIHLNCKNHHTAASSTAQTPSSSTPQTPASKNTAQTPASSTAQRPCGSRNCRNVTKSQVGSVLPGSENASGTVLNDEYNEASNVTENNLFQRRSYLDRANFHTENLAHAQCSNLPTSQTAKDEPNAFKENRQPTVNISQRFVQRSVPLPPTPAFEPFLVIKKPIDLLSSKDYIPARKNQNGKVTSNNSFDVDWCQERMPSFGSDADYRTNEAQVSSDAWYNISAKITRLEREAASVPTVKKVCFNLNHEGQQSTQNFPQTTNFQEFFDEDAKYTKSDTNAVMMGRAPVASTSSSSAGSEYCAFCWRNGERDEVYLSHKLRNRWKEVTCPVLYKHTCEYCGATGKTAHTATYCPMATYYSCGRRPVSTSLIVKSSMRKSNGQLRNHKTFKSLTFLPDEN